ncbi:MAG: sigma-70 family RNA polymerase sigma factor [Sandaracinaceae bacterium]
MGSDEEFVRTHEALVRRLAAQVKAQLELPTEVEELAAYGFQGLLEARARFDPTRGVPFAAFAHYRVRGAILDGVRRMAYLPRKVHARRRAAEALDHVAEEVGERRAVAPQGPAAAGARAALTAADQVLGRASAAFLLSAVGQAPEEDDGATPESVAVSGQLRERVRAALGALPPRERALVEGHYFQERTLEEVGATLGISKSWASRLHSRALARLRSLLDEELLP